MMTDTEQNTIPERNKGETSLKEVWLIIAMAVVAFGAGFAVVHLALPDESRAKVIDGECLTSDVAPAAATSTSGDETAPVDDGGDAQEAAPDEGSALPEVPPGKTPDGVRIDGLPAYLKCMDGDNTISGNDCDRLRVFEKRMRTRVYVVAECKKEIASEAKGILSLGVNIDFGQNAVKFWSGPSSELENASQIGACVRDRLAGLPIHGIAHKFDGYRMFYTISFFDAAKREQELKRLRNRGRNVKVILDRVNVREEPVDGLSFGRISSGTEVVFLGKNDSKEWCKVLTPNNHEGWMICTALNL